MVCSPRKECPITFRSVVRDTIVTSATTLIKRRKYGNATLVHWNILQKRNMFAQEIHEDRLWTKTKSYKYVRQLFNPESRAKDCHYCMYIRWQWVFRIRIPRTMRFRSIVFVHELCMYNAISGVGNDKLLHVYQDNGIGRYR